MKLQFGERTEARGYRKENENRTEILRVKCAANKIKYSKRAIMSLSG